MCKFVSSNLCGMLVRILGSRPHRWEGVLGKYRSALLHTMQGCHY